MRGRAEVRRQRQRLDFAFGRYQAVGDDLEVKADFARYLCVLLCGYLETAIRELVSEHCRLRSERTVASHASAQLSRFQNPNTRRIAALVAAFDLNWQAQVDDYMADERKNAVDSIMGSGTRSPTGRMSG